jgi:hypothetical protein
MKRAQLLAAGLVVRRLALVLRGRCAYDRILACASLLAQAIRHVG